MSDGMIAFLLFAATIYGISYLSKRRASKKDIPRQMEASLDFAVNMEKIDRLNANKNEKELLQALAQARLELESEGDFKSMNHMEWRIALMNRAEAIRQRRT